MATSASAEPRKGPGRPRLTPGKDATRHTITLPADMVAEIRQLGGGKLSAGVQALYAHWKARPTQT